MTEVNDTQPEFSPVPESLLDKEAKFTVIGSGVIGLLVAKELSEKGHAVKVISHEGKPDENTSAASSIAVGQFLPWLPEEHASNVMQDLVLETIVEGSRGFYQELAETPHETGVMAVRNIEFVNGSLPWPAELPGAMRAEERYLESPILYIDPTGKEVVLDKQYTFDSFSINTKKTIAWLADHAERLGVKFEKKLLNADDLAQLDGIVINAAGTGAYEFDPANKVANYKGHTFVIQPREGFKPPEEALSVDDLIIVPREDGTVVCGALYIEDPIRPVPEASEALELQTRLSHLIHQAAASVKGLDPELLEHSDVLVHRAGYRVEHEGGGFRVAPDEKNQKLLHAYGFAGIGWSVGPHFAKHIADQAVEIYNTHQED